MQQQKISPTSGPQPLKQNPFISYIMDFAFKSQSPQFLKSIISQQLSQLPDKNVNVLNLDRCYRCKENLSEVTCNLCKMDFCKVCDNSVHNLGKFKLHHRNPSNPQPQPPTYPQPTEPNPYNIKISEVQKNQAHATPQKNTQQITITQKWDKIISDLEHKFKDCVLLLQEKKEEIIGKLEKKRSQQLKLCVDEGRNGQKSYQCSNTKRSQVSQKSDVQVSRLKSSGCDHSDENRKCLGAYELNSSIFQQLKSTIEKIEIKTMLTKIACSTQPQAKKKRGSMLLNLSSLTTPYTSSSTLRSPKPKLSKSIWVQQPKTSEKVNEQQQQLKLHKIKSQKLIVKKNMDLSVISPRKDNKIKKLELMI